MTIRSFAALFMTALLCAPVYAGPSSLDEAVSDIAHRWAKINYQTPDAEKKSAFNALIADSSQLTKIYPGKAEPMIWEAITLSSAAKAEGGLGALGKVKEARDLLLASEKINPTALNGSIYNSLGSLYAKVPGWPIAFGNKKKAREYFEKALAINPNGIDPNYFYGEMLAEEGEYVRAVDFLKRALGAPARPGREDADSGRRQEVQHLLASIGKNHAEQLAIK